MIKLVPLNIIYIGTYNEPRAPKIIKKGKPIATEV